MSSIAMKRRVSHAKNIISCKEMLNLSDDDCVKISSCYFHYLVAKSQLLNISDADIIEIFNKYLQVEKINYYLNKKRVINASHYLMSVSDAKRLITKLNELSTTRTFIVVDITKPELEAKFVDLNEQYLENQKANKSGFTFRKKH